VTRQTALVTGGTDGIGKEIAHRLARRGVRVFVVGSGAAKGRFAERALRRETANDEIYFLRADLASMREVHLLVEEIASRCRVLDYLVLSAGVVRGRRILSAEGIESNFAIGYLSRFVLARHLSAANILVINGAAHGGTIYYDDVNLTRNFATLRAVSQLCEANDVFVLEFARRCGVKINALKVGVVPTGIRRGFPWWMKLAVPLLDPFLALTTAQVADRALEILTDPAFDHTTGALFSLIRKFRQVQPGRHTSDVKIGEQLWHLSLSLESKALGGYAVSDSSAMRPSIR
jgi:NAD(P)-dependent dehydrogenase (short-subunit alcohol dehydrogenase family)